MTMSMFLQGAAAGLAIAVPVGPVAVLIIDRGVSRGFRDAAVAGLGAASADLFYAVAAVTVGVAGAQLLSPLATPLRILSVAVLLWMALRSTLRAIRTCCERSHELTAGKPAGTYVTFLGITLLNPLTMVYFASLVIGLDLGMVSVGGKAAFALGAFAASASWQTALARGGAWIGGKLGPRFGMLTTLVGSAAIAAIAVRTAIAM